MKPERLKTLSLWLERLAEQEDGTAKVLRKILAGDPLPCEQRARLFREVAEALRAISPASSGSSPPTSAPYPEQ